VKQVGGMEVDASTAGNEVILSDPAAIALLQDMDRITAAYIDSANIEINDKTLEVINANRHFNSQSFQQFKNGIKKITAKIPVSDESQPAFDTFESHIQDSLETVFSGTDSRTRWYEFIVNIMNSIFGFFSQYNKPTRSQAILIIRIFYFCRGYIDAISRERRKAMLDHAGDMERRTAMETFLSLEQMHFTTTQNFSNTELYKQEIEKRRYLPTASIIQDPRTNTHYRELMMCIGCGEFADQQLKKVLGLFKTGIELQFIEYEQMVEEVKKLETAFLIDPTNLAKTQERLRSISSSSPAGMPLQGPPVQFVNVEQPEAAGMESPYGAAGAAAYRVSAPMPAGASASMPAARHRAHSAAGAMPAPARKFSRKRKTAVSAGDSQRPEKKLSRNTPI